MSGGLSFLADEIGKRLSPLDDGLDGPIPQMGEGRGRITLLPTGKRSSGLRSSLNCGCPRLNLPGSVRAATAPDTEGSQGVISQWSPRLR